MRRTLLTLICLVTAASVLAQVRKEEVTGIRNFNLIDDMTACAGATDAAALAGLAVRGYKSVVNLRLDTETGAAIEVSRAAAAAAGLKYIHLPFDGAAPDMAVADAFIAAVIDKDHQPVYVHCASANRASALWLAKRMLVDKWSLEKAVEEAKAIGLTSAALEKFALEYVAARRK